MAPADEQSRCSYQSGLMTIKPIDQHTKSDDAGGPLVLPHHAAWMAEQ